MKHKQGEGIIWQFANRVFNTTTQEWEYYDCDATYPKLTVVNSGGIKKVDAQVMVAIDTGQYVYPMTIAADELEGDLIGTAAALTTITLGGTDYELPRTAKYVIEVLPA
jgi:hypothetical protein